MENSLVISQRSARHSEEGEIVCNTKKRSFLANSLTFLDYVVSFEGLKVDLSKVQVIQDWQFLAEFMMFEVSMA